MTLALADTTRPMTLFVEVDEAHAGAILAQENNGRLCPIATRGKDLLPTEKRLPLLERLLVSAVWFLTKFVKYCAYAPRIDLVLPTRLELSALQAKTLPVRIQAQLVLLTGFNVSFSCGEGAFGMVRELGMLEWGP